MALFAQGTTVSSEKSRAEIETLLRRYGADQFMSGWSGRRAVIGFRAAQRNIRFELTLPDPKDQAFQSKRRIYRRSYYNRAQDRREYITAGGSGDKYEAEVRRRWRSLALVIKAKLEAVQTGITTFEDEFMAHIVMPDGKTIAQHVSPQIAAAYATGKVRALLPEWTS